MTHEEFYKQGNRKCMCNAAFCIEKTEKTVNYGRGGIVNRFFKTYTKTQVRFWVRCVNCQKGYFVSDKKRDCKTILDILNNPLN